MSTAKTAKTISATPTKPIVRLEAYEFSCLTNQHGCYVISRETVLTPAFGVQMYYTVQLDNVRGLYACGLPTGAVEAILADATTK